MSFFPSSSYLRKLIRSSEERLEFLESEELLPKNTARKDEILNVKSELKTEIVKLKQDLKLTEEPDPVQVKKTYAKIPASATKYVPFNDWSQERLLLGSKTATSRTSQYGSIGDTFQAGDKSFELTDISRKNLWDISQNYYLDEGAKSPEEFIEVWNSLHPKGFDPEQVVYFHKFRELTPETVQLKELLLKPSLTQEESRISVALAQKIYKTESRKVLTARENIALNTQVRKNLGESYGLLIQEGEIKAAKAAAFRKRQLEEELNILGKIARKTEAPEIPPLSPLTDKNFVKNTDTFPFITYEPRPPVNYVLKPKEIDIPGFAPQWFSRFDKKEESFFADWMENQEENLKMVLDEKEGTYSAAISRGKTTEFKPRSVNFPENIEGTPTPYLPTYSDPLTSILTIKGTLRIKRTEKELEALAKKERLADARQIIEDAKKVYIKRGGKLEEKDFWEYQINKKGEVYQRSAFFRTPDGDLVYAGGNEKIMLESRLSQAVPGTGLEDVSFYDSEKIKKRIEERAKAYDKEQFDQDTILTNRGLPVKDADKLRRDTERFEKDFIVNFMINHPDQLKPWLEAADPKTIRYLNNVLGGEEVLRRKWLPQIEFKGRLHEIGRTKASYELPERLPPDTEELLKRDLEKDTLLDIGISPAKIERVVKGPAPERTKNTVIYIVGHSIPKDPKDYESFIQRLRTGREPYFAKLGEEIEEETAKKPEHGLGLSVSTDILDLLKGKDIPEGVKVSSPLELKNDIQVVRYVPPIKNMASFTPLQDAWKKGMEAIAEQTTAITEKYPDAAIGRIIKLNNAPTRFGAAQEGVLLTDEGKEIQFIAYKKDNPPLLKYNNRYSLKNPGETIEGSKTISRITQKNVEETNFPSQQITTRGIVYDVVDVNDPSGTAQYGHIISPTDGKLIKFTTFSRDNPPVLKRNQAYTIYNTWLQGFQTNTGKVELNINIKPENIYPERAAVSNEQKALAEELRAVTYKTEVHPTDYKPFTGQPPKPQKKSIISDPVIATAVENGEVIVITSSGKRMPGREYAKQYASLKPKKEAGAAYDEETLDRIEDEIPLDEDRLFMLGLLPIGALGMGPEELTGEKARKDLRQTMEDARAGLTDEELNTGMRRRTAGEDTLEAITGAYNVLGELGSIWYQKASEANERIKARSEESDIFSASVRAQGDNFGGVMSRGADVLDVFGGALYPVSYPQQALWGEASGIGAMEGIRQEITPSRVLGTEDPLTALGEDILLDPLNLIGVGVASKGKKFAGGIKSLAKSESGELFGRTTEEQLALNQGRASAWHGAESSKSASIEPAIKPKTTEDFMAEYDARPLSNTVKSRLEELSQIPYQQLSWAEKSELDELAFRNDFWGLDPKTDIPPLTQEDFLRQDRISTDIQRRMNAKNFKTEPVGTTIDAKPVAGTKVPMKDHEIDQVLREQPTPAELTSPLQDTQAVKEISEEPVSLKEIRKKLFFIRKEIAKKEAEDSYPNLKRTGLIALGGVTGVTAAAIGLAGLINEQQQEEIKNLQEAEAPSLPAPINPETATPTPAPSETGEPSSIAQPGKTAMDVAAPLAPVVSGGWDVLMNVLDILQTASYAEGGLIKSAQSVIDNPSNWDNWKFYGYQWKVTPSEALGVVETDELSWRTIPALAIDIGLDPTTYLSFGATASTKIGASGLKRIALNPKGVKALRELKELKGAKEAENIFSDMLTDPKIRKQYQAAEGLSLRGWGPFFGGHEYELISKSTLDAAAAVPKEFWDKTLRTMATSGDPQTEKAAEILLKSEQFTGKQVGRVKDWTGRKFIPNYEISKLPRPLTLAPREPEYIERATRMTHTIRHKSLELTKRMEKLRDEARKELGEGYKETVARYLESPVLRESANLSPKTVSIIEELETLQKGFAEAEMERGLLDTQIEGYLKHMLSPEAKEYLQKEGKTSTEVFRPLLSTLNSARSRGYKGTLEEINKASQAQLGFNLFDPDPFKAVAVRGAESFKATETFDLLEYAAKHYGSKVYEVSDPATMAFAKRTPQLMNLLPPEVSETMLGEAKNILKKLEPAREFHTEAGKKFHASDILRIASENELIGEKIATQAAREVIEGEFGKKVATANPGKEDIARVALLLDQLQKGVPEKEAVEYAKTRLMNVELPGAIVENLEPAIRQPMWYDEALKQYDKGLNIWKWAQTVPFPAYHAGNLAGGVWNGVILGGTNPLSTLDAFKILKNKQGTGMIRTALGEEYSYAEVYSMAGNLGVFGQPGMMDITGKMEFSEKTDLLSRSIQTASRIDPANAARTEENIMRLSMFVDRLKRGDTPDDAARYTTKFMFDYMPEAKTGFQKDVMARGIPFLTWQWNNIMLQSEMLLKQPGKYGAFAKTSDAAMGGEETPDWAKSGYMTALTDPGKFAFMRTPITDLSFYSNPLMYTAQALTPFLKAPLEAAAGRSFFTGKDITPEEAVSGNFPGRSATTWNMLTSETKSSEEKMAKFWAGTGTARTQTGKDLEERFKKASRRKEDFTWQQRFEGWKRDEMASPLSGIPDELQGGHIQAVVEGGKAEMSNFLTMTIEENLEQTSSQLFRTSLPEKKFLQDKFWEETKVKEGEKLQESTLSTTEKLEKEGKWVNNAVREKLEYDAKKTINIQLYSRELAKIRMQLDWAERRLRNEQRGMERKRKDPDFKGDKWSERQIQALEWFIPKYQAQYAAIERLREQERTKEFELPEQIIQGEDYNKGMLGKEREVNIRGKGPALADPEQIKDMVKYDEIALERAVILEDVAILDLPKYIPKHIRDSIKKPTGSEWKEKQDKAAWYARAIWGDEPEVPNEPEPVENQEEGWIVSPLMPVASVALINMGMGRTWPAPRSNRPRKTPASPLERSAGGEPPGWNLRLPSVSDVVSLFVPHADAAEPVSEEAVQQKADLAKEEFLESDEFITAVQSIVTDYLDRGIER